VEQLDTWRSKTKKHKKADVDPRFVKSVQQKTERALDKHPELLLKSKFVKQNEILREPSLQLQSILK